MKFVHDNQRGVILVMTLMVMAILLSIALGFALFIYSDINQAHMVDNSIVAYYGAESGFERTMYLFRKQGKDKIGGFSYNPTVPGTDQKALSLSDQQGDLTVSKSHWTIAGSQDYEPVVFRQHLKNGQSVKLYFLNRINATGGNGSNGSQNIAIEWYKVGACHLQVSYTQLRPQSEGNVLVNYTDRVDTELNDSSVDGYSYCRSFLDRVKPGSDQEKAGITNWKSDYVVEIKALGMGDDYCVDSLRVTGYDTSDCSGSNLQNAITNVTIHSVGTYNNATQEIVAHIPPYDPFSGLLSFVLFSEQDITKSY